MTAMLSLRFNSAEVLALILVVGVILLAVL
jgi:hypothetical protein